MSPRIHDAKVDRYSRDVLQRAADLARDRLLSPAARQNAIDALAAEKEAMLRRDFEAGRITRDQFDGGATALDGVGGELGEIRQAANLAKTLLGSPDAARRLARNPLLFTSDVFHNATLTAATADGQSVHIRFGTHGGLENRAANPSADGFPFPGTKWVEGDVVIGDRVYSFVDSYTDNFKVDTDAKGRPVALRFRGEVEVKRANADLLASGREKWSARRPPTRSEGRAVLELSIPLRASGGAKASYGLPGMGFEDRNFALSASGGTVTVRPAGGGAAKTLNLADGFGQLEAGSYKNVPRDLPAVYTFAQGQRIDTAQVFARALAHEPQAVLGLLVPGSPLHREVVAVAGGAAPSPHLAQRVDGHVRARAQLDADLRRAAAPVIVRHLGGALLPKSPEGRTTSTQFEGRLLREDLAGRLISRLMGRAVDEAGALDAAGVFRSYENKVKDLFVKNPDFVDPVAVLNVNHVPLYMDGRDKPALLERRTDLLFDARAGAFAIGFQEVFHDE